MAKLHFRELPPRHLDGARPIEDERALWVVEPPVAHGGQCRGGGKCRSKFLHVPAETEPRQPRVLRQIANETFRTVVCVDLIEIELEAPWKHP